MAKRKKSGARRSGNPALRAPAPAVETVPLPLDPEPLEVAAAPLLDELADIYAEARQAQLDVQAAVDEAREAGHSWQEIADTVGLSRQTAHRRYARP